jgi:endonuclease/exonuclease/phosphatase family metal-dependent hydrolase
MVRDRLSDGPSVLMGDFNTPETSKVLTTLRNEAGFIDAFRIVNPDSADRQRESSHWGLPSCR